MKRTPPIVLASASPRRAEILSMLGLEFTIQPTGIDETFIQGTPPEKTVEDLAVQKAQSAAEGARGAVVIASDTLVIMGLEVLGKPLDADDARRMLERLSGSEHRVYSGLCVFKDGVMRSGYAYTTVRMRTLSKSEIDTYVATGEPLDKAGAYAIQGRGAIFIEEIKGDFFTVVGLPVFLLDRFLKEIGIDVMQQTKRSALIELVYEKGCPNVTEVRRNLSSALQIVAPDIPWREWDRDDPAAPAYAAHFTSPSILIDGRDLLNAAPDLSGARGCRVYRKADGTYGGSPSHDELAALLIKVLARL